MSDHSIERVIFVEYQDGRPHSVVTDGHTYDFEWSRREGQLYYEKAGGGGKSITVYPNSTYWAAPGVELKAYRSDGPPWTRPLDPGESLGTRLAEPPPGWPNEELFDLAEESETVWCDTCRDHLPSEDTPTPCDHVWWCNSHGWSTPEERCPDTCSECVSEGRSTRNSGLPLRRLAQGYGLIAEPSWRRHPWRRDPDDHFRHRGPMAEIARGLGRAARAHFEERESAG